jgi:general stress protein 26
MEGKTTTESATPKEVEDNGKVCLSFLFNQYFNIAG